MFDELVKEKQNHCLEAMHLKDFNLIKKTNHLQLHQEYRASGFSEVKKGEILVKSPFSWLLTY